MSFDHLKEQQSVELLQRSLERGRLGHAYLFSGPSMDELEVLARMLAQTLNCQQPPRRGASGMPLDCCDRCLSCRKINAENHPDVQWIRPESKTRIITIDQMRELIQAINLKPTEALCKVAVIVAADRLNVQAANAFLKTLEEPPPKSVIILLTIEPGQILETVLSRCLRLNFTGEQEFAVRDLNADWLAEFGALASGKQKGLLSRYRLLGIVLGRLGELRNDAEKMVTARSPLERYDDIEPKLRERWEDEMAAAIEAEYRRRRLELFIALQWWLRDIWLHTLIEGEKRLAVPNLAEASRDVAERISTVDATENLHVLEQLQSLLATNVQEALALEVGLLKLKL